MARTSTTEQLCQRLVDDQAWNLAADALEQAKQDAGRQAGLALRQALKDLGWDYDSLAKNASNRRKLRELEETLGQQFTDSVDGTLAALRQRI